MTNPKHLALLADPIGPDNDAHLDREAARHDVIVFAWGAHADPARARAVAHPVVADLPAHRWDGCLPWMDR